MLARIAAVPWWLQWALARGLGLAVIGLFTRATSDADYLLGSLLEVGTVGWGSTLREYPLPVVVALWPATLPVRAGLPPWAALALVVLVVDLAFAWWLGRAGRPARPMWTWGVLALGPVALQRLDLLAGVALAASVVGLAPAARSVWIALGTGTKVFGLAALPALLVSAARPVRLLAWTAASGLVLVVVSAAVGGPARVLSPLTYQGSRGLQVESVAASPFLAARLFSPGTWQTAYAPSSKSYEVTGPGVPLALTLSSVALVVLLVLVSALVCVAARHRPWTQGPARAAWETWAVLGTVGGLVCTSRVLSPQYLLWLLPLAVAAWSVVSTDPERGRTSWAWPVGLGISLLLTQAVFPVAYDGLIGDTTASSWPATLSLVARNLLLLWLTASALRRAGAVARGRVPSAVPGEVVAGGR